MFLWYNLCTIDLPSWPKFFTQYATKQNNDNPNYDSNVSAPASPTQPITRWATGPGLNTGHGHGHQSGKI